MTKNSKQYSPEKLEKFKTIIENELKIIDKELTELKDDRQDQKQRQANTNVDFNQSSKHFQQKAKNKQIISRLQRKSRELKAALKRVEDETYGVCERTGELIQEERLAAKPTARFDVLKK